MTLKNNQRGFVTLMAEVVALALILIIAAMSVPNILAYKRGVDRTNVAETLKRIQRAELYHSQMFSDGWRSPGALAYSPRTFPATCEGSGLLMGSDALSAQGSYTLTWTGGGGQIAPAVGCALGGFNSFALSATSSDPGQKRSYYLDQTLVLRYSDGAAANASSSPYIW